MRRITIKWIKNGDECGAHQDFVPGALNTRSDSEALHHMLCEIDPGEEYTVVFSNV